MLKCAYTEQFPFLKPAVSIAVRAVSSQLEMYSPVPFFAEFKAIQ